MFCMIRVIIPECVAVNVTWGLIDCVLLSRILCSDHLMTTGNGVRPQPRGDVGARRRRRPNEESSVSEPTSINNHGSLISLANFSPSSTFWRLQLWFHLLLLK